MLKFCIFLQIISTISGLYLLPKDDNFTSFETISNPLNIKDRLLVKHLIVVDADNPDPTFFENIESIGSVAIIIYTIIALIWIAAAAIGFFFYWRSLTCKLSTKSNPSNVKPSKDGLEANRKSIVG